MTRLNKVCFDIISNASASNVQMVETVSLKAYNKLRNNKLFLRYEFTVDSSGLTACGRRLSGRLLLVKAQWRLQQCFFFRGGAMGKGGTRPKAGRV